MSDENPIDIIVEILNRLPPSIRRSQRLYQLPEAPPPPLEPPPPEELLLELERLELELELDPPPDPEPDVEMLCTKMINAAKDATGIATIQPW